MHKGLHRDTMKIFSKQNLKFSQSNMSALTQPCSSIEVGVGLLNEVTTTGSPKAVLARKLSLIRLRSNVILQKGIGILMNVTYNDEKIKKSMLRSENTWTSKVHTVCNFSCSNFKQ